MRYELKTIRETEIKVDGGYVTQYVDFECWVRKFEKGGEGLVVIKDSGNGIDNMLRYCTIACVIDGKNPKYEELIVENEKKLLCDYSVEFITNDNIYYVFLIEDNNEDLDRPVVQVADKIEFVGYYEIC